MCYGIRSQEILNFRITDTPSQDSSIQLGGYYIRRFEKNKIKDIAKNRQNRLRGKPFRIVIDTELSEDFFFPANNNSVNLEKVLYGSLNSGKESVYLYCTNANYSIFNAQFWHESEKLKVDSCVQLKSNKYFMLSKTDRYCYQVYYLSGKWMVGFANTPVQKQLFQKQRKDIDTSSSFKVFLLHHIMLLDEVQSAPLKLWRVVPGVLDK